MRWAMMEVLDLCRLRWLGLEISSLLIYLSCLQRYGKFFFLYTFLILLGRLVCACDGIAIDYCPFLVGWLVACLLACMCGIYMVWCCGVLQISQDERGSGYRGWILGSLEEFVRRTARAFVFVCVLFSSFFSFRDTKLVLNQAH